LSGYDQPKEMSKMALAYFLLMKNKPDRLENQSALAQIPLLKCTSQV
jgi:hypothetical protein